MLIFAAPRLIPENPSPGGLARHLYRGASGDATVAQLDHLLRERLLTLAHIRLAKRPEALAAFEAELALPDGAAIGARVRLLDLPGFRVWAVMGDADKFDHKLLTAIDAWAAGEPTVQPLCHAETPAERQMGKPSHPRDDSQSVAQELRALRKTLERRATYEQVHAGFRRIAEATRQGAETARNPPPSRAVSHATAQEEEILDALRRLGYDPLRLPAAPRGKSWPAKDAARKSLRLTRAQFDKAWQRLRNDEKISEA